MTPNQFDLALPLRIVPLGGLASIEEANGRIVCTVHERDAEQIVRSVNAFPALLAVLKELVRDVECYCADNVASKEPCASCKAKEVLKQAEAPI